MQLKDIFPQREGEREGGVQAAKKRPSSLLSFPLVPSTTNDVSGGGASKPKKGENECLHKE